MSAPTPIRPAQLVGVVATGTEIGKTWTTAAVAQELVSRGVRVSARKPAQSFAADSDEPTDAAVLASATGEHPDVVCPAHRSYRVPMAPPMAADALGRPRPTTAELLGELSWADGTEIGFVETVGGTCSPLAADADSVGFVEAVGVDRVVLVADAGLGTVNAIRTALLSLPGHDVVVFLNRFDPDTDLHVRNRDWLVDEDGTDVVTTVSALADLLAERP